MPKGKSGKPLHGAALAAYNRARAGRPSTALVRRPSSAVAKRSTAIAKTRTKTVYVPVKRKAHAAHRGGTAGVVATLKAQVPDLAAATAYGYLTRSDTVKAIELRAQTLDHLPTSAKLGKPLSHGIVGTIVASLLPQGMARKVVGHMAHAALMQAASNFGAAAGNTETFATMAGDEGGGDGGADFSGAIDAEAVQR